MSGMVEYAEAAIECRSTAHGLPILDRRRFGTSLWKYPRYVSVWPAVLPTPNRVFVREGDAESAALPCIEGVNAAQHAVRDPPSPDGPSIAIRTR
jgi:hypothetical protein